MIGSKTPTELVARTAELILEAHAAHGRGDLDDEGLAIVLGTIEETVDDEVARFDAELPSREDLERRLAELEARA